MLERLLDPREPLEHLLVHPIGLLVEVRDLELGLEVDLVLDVVADRDRARAWRLPLNSSSVDRMIASSETVIVSRLYGNGSNAERRRVEADPRREEDHVEHEERDAAGEVRDPIGDAHHDVAAIDLDLLVDVARHARLEQRVRLARHPAHRREHVERGIGALAEQLLEILAIEHRAARRASIDRRGRGARAAVEQRQLAEELAGLGDVQHDLLAGLVLDEQLDLPVWTMNIESPGSPALNSTSPAFTARSCIADASTRALVVVELLEQRDARQEPWIHRHWPTIHRSGGYPFVVS